MKKPSDSKDRKNEQDPVKPLDRVARWEVANEITTSLRQMEEALKKDALR